MRQIDVRHPGQPLGALTWGSMNCSREKHMTRLPLSIALAIVAILPALGEDVPFAAPPPPNLGQSSTYLASLGDIMGKIQSRRIKLWYAIKSKNWELLDYELSQIRNSFENAVIFYRNIPVDFIVSADKPLIALQEAVKSKDGAKLERGFADLTTACNNCHKAAQVGFIFIQTPTYSPFSDQKFQPTHK
jgi:hypothetical protein